jgi:hypothetical protein
MAEAFFFPAFHTVGATQKNRDFYANFLAVNTEGGYLK